MKADVLALVVESDDAAYNICDSRDGSSLTWRSSLEEANAVAAYLNTAYPSGMTWPSRDVLAYELVELRIGGPPLMLETEIMLGRIKTRCDWGVPTGLGWDHLIEEAG